MNIITSIKIITRNSGSKTAGPDGKNIKDVINNDLNENIKEIKNRLIGKTKCSGREVLIPKENGKFRPLGITNIYDRIAQQCVRNILEPIVEAHFNPESFGFRKGRNAQQCISYIATTIQRNNEGHIYDCDLESYFDTVNLDIVINLLKKNHKIHDKAFLRCIKRLMWIDLNNKKEKYNGIGLRQGTILGPILANVMFHDFELKLNEINDFKRKNGREIIQNPNIFKNFGKNYNRGREFYFNWLKNRRVVKIVRYADDLLLISKGKYDIYDAIMLLEDWCNENNLKINKDKTKLIRISDNVSVNFLGYKIKKKETKENSFLLSPKDQNKIWKETKKRLEYALYNNKISYFKTYISGILNYYNIATNMTWLISRIHLYLIRIMKRKRKRYGKIEYSKKNNVIFYLNNEILDLWEMRKRSISNTREYMINLHKYWDPNNDKDYSPIRWLEEFYEGRKHGIDRNSSNLIYVPSLIKQFKKEPITGKLYYLCSPKEIEIHHKIPISKGGTDEYKNLILLRKECHKVIHKKNLTKEEIPEYMLVKEINKYRKLCGLEVI